MFARILPMLASDLKGQAKRFPIAMMPKIDGVRANKFTSLLTGRSMEPHANWHVTSHFSLASYDGFDGEMAAEIETHPDLCRLTSSALSTREGTPNIVWHLFDYVTYQTQDLPYQERYAALKARVEALQEESPILKNFLQVVPLVVVHNEDELKAQHLAWIEQGYEGSILRTLEGKHKSGRSTAKEGDLLRIKDFVEEDAIVLKILEGDKNNNEAKKNALGRTERSSHKANKVPNGMVGKLVCQDVKTGKVILVTPGRMPHKDRLKYFQNPELLIGQMIKYKYFNHGIKDRPRFATFQSIRIESDKPCPITPLSPKNAASLLTFPLLSGACPTFTSSKKSSTTKTAAPSPTCTL